MSIATGGSSTVVSLSVDTEMVFNLALEHDALALLRRIHLSALSLDLKNYLRDLVFSTRFGDVVPVDTAFTATFASHGFSVSYEPVEIAPVAAVSSPVLSKVSISSIEPDVADPVSKASAGFGFQRTTPVFVAPAVSAPTTPVVSPVVPVLVAPVVVSAPVVSVQPPTAPVAVVEPAAVAQTVSVEPAPIAPEVPTPTPAPVSVPVQAEPVAVTAVPAERIAAIKHEVNALVGNPVNLIDVNNDVGREYMNALLDAMKKSLGGTPAQEVERAMARLERSFTDVKKVLSEADAAVAADVPSAAEEPIVSEAPVDDNRWSAPADGMSEIAPAEALPEVPETVPEPVSTEPAAHVTPVVDAVTPQLHDNVLESVAVPEPEVEATPAVATGFAAEAAVSPISEANTGPELVPAVTPEVVSLSSVVPATAPTEVITSVAKEKQLRELMEARHAAEAEASAERAEINAHNPLMADDVTRGLTQLLSEWKLFKSSGIFGTGPSGHEHPLYKKIAPLTMAAVLAGRFDGATPEIKRSITDYMNGWRYEEGVTHEVGESFENYLRRVIRHILDNQIKS